MSLIHRETRVKTERAMIYDFVGTVLACMLVSFSITELTSTKSTTDRIKTESEYYRVQTRLRMRLVFIYFFFLRLQRLQQNILLNNGTKQNGDVYIFLYRNSFVSAITETLTK